MIIDGKGIASEILEELKPQVLRLKQNGITPTLAIISIGDDKSSLSYIKQKKIKASEIRAEVKLFRFQSTTQPSLISLIEKLNDNPGVHGIIVQRPLPKNIDRGIVSSTINPRKDVDGFNPKSDFDAPVALAVLEVLKTVGETNLANRKIAVLGKGETAGGPIIKILEKHGVKPFIIDSRTENPENIIRSSDIIISAVGKENIVKPELLNKNQILIGVGLFSKDGKLKGDYEVNEIEGKVKYYTPTLGGVGPVNVAFLMSNLVHAARAQTP